MALKCQCGSTRFKPIGIQESWPGRQSGDSPRILFLVNCLECGTTKVCSRLDYALIRNEETAETIDKPS